MTTEVTEDKITVEGLQDSLNSAPQEKLLTQSEVNDLVGTAKAVAERKARKQAEAEFNQRMQELESQKRAAEAKGEDTTELNVDAIYQQVNERLNKELEQKQAEQEIAYVVNNFKAKIDEGSQKYDDFSTVMQNFDAGAFQNTSMLVSFLDNGADILYDLAKNPRNLTYIEELATRSPKMAQAELAKLGKSIQTNQEAVNQASGQETPPPLDRMQSSNKTGGSGKMGVADYKAADWLRG